MNLICFSAADCSGQSVGRASYCASSADECRLHDRVLDDRHPHVHRIWQSSGDRQKHFSINLAAVVIALAFCFLRIPIPHFIASTSEMMGSMAVPFMLILTGAALYFSAGNLLKHPLDAAYLSVLRLLVLPSVLIFLLKLFPLEKEMSKSV